MPTQRTSMWHRGLVQPGARFVSLLLLFLVGAIAGIAYLSLGMRPEGSDFGPLWYLALAVGGVVSLALVIGLTALAFYARKID